MAKIILKKGREDSLKRLHPWVFSGSIAQIVGKPAEGDVVAVYANDGSFLATGHYQIGSISVRVLSFESETLPQNFWKVMLSKALSLREACGLANDSPEQTNCYRLVHGEGDCLPGLIIDYYDGVCVFQAHSAGMFRAKRQICDALCEIYGERLKAVYDKSSGTAPFKAGLDLVDGYIYKRDNFSDKDFVVIENGHRFYVDWSDVYALCGGAAHVDSIDSSGKAVDMVNRNIALNGFDESLHTSHCTDAIDFLRNSPADKYDLIIVDPPAFAKHRGAINNALRAYQRLNACAIEKIRSKGFIFTFSCSQVVDKEAFALAIFSAAAQTGRTVRIIDRFNQPADHAVNIYHPEGEYLKGLLLYVE